MEIGMQKITEILAEVERSESKIGIKNDACRSKFFIHPDSTAKVCLFFHGFTAGPYQFEPLGKAFFNAGYNVLIPLLPGHGLAGEWNRQHPQPLPRNIQVYQDFVVKWLDIAENMGEQVVVGGLSTGGTLAAWLALNYPQHIHRALLFTPYLGSRYFWVDWLIKSLPIYFEWFNKDASGNFGYKGFLVPALRIFLELGEQVLKQVKTVISPPTLIVSSEADSVVNLSRQQNFFKILLTQQPKCWYYCFDDSLEIEHRMMTKMEDNDYEELVIIIAQAFVESDLSWTQFQQVVTRLGRGEVYEEIQGEFNIDGQVSAQLSAMMTQRFGCDHLKCINPD